MLAASAAFAQTAQPDNNVEQVSRPTSTVTAAATAERVRFTSPNTVVQLRLEVYDEAGQKLLDTEQRGGNVLDWHLQGGVGERVADGVYFCVLTSKNLSGRLSQKLGRVIVRGQLIVVQTAAVAELNLRQAQTVGPIEIGDGGLTVMGAEAAPPVTLLAHNGNEAQLARTRGALTFRVGDFFSGTDTEQMRLTEEGSLGIGTTKPKVKLDVAGIIRAREGFMFSDGSTLKVNEKGVLTRTIADGTPPNFVTTTQNQLAKFTDNAGTVGDSVVTESAGNIGIGTPTPAQALDVANGRVVTTGTQTISAPGGILEIGTTVTNNHNQASGIRMRNLFNGNASLQQGLDVAPTFAPSANISLARGFISAAFFAPPSGVTITDAYGGNAVNVYNNTGGAVTNGAAFAINSPFVFGALKPTTQFGLHINNQGIAGTVNTYGLFVDAQSGSANNYSAIFAGGNVGIGTTNPQQSLSVNSALVVDQADVNNGGVVPGITFGSNSGEGIASKRTSGGNQWGLNFFTSGANRLSITNGGNVGIGTSGPLFKFHVKTANDQNLVVRPAADFSGSLTGIGLQSINDPNTLYQPLDLEGSQVTLNVGSAGNVGIGTAIPAQKLSVAGTVESTSGGFKFPDGSVQTTAAANAVYTKVHNIYNYGSVFVPNDQSYISILHLDLPTATYQVTVTFELANTNSSYRNVQCRFTGDPSVDYSFDIFGSSQQLITMHTLEGISSGGVDAQCHVLFTNGGSNSNIYVNMTRMTAVKIAGSVNVQ